MKRLEGGYLGGRPTWSLASNPGIWAMEQVFARRVAGTWPVGAGSFDEYYEYVTFMLHANGANASTSFPDSSLYGRAVTVNGNAQVSTAQSKFGGASVYFDGTGDYLTTPVSSSIEFGSGDFTVETWIRFGSISGEQAILSLGNGANGVGPVQCGWSLRFNSNVLYWYRYAHPTETAVSFSWAPSANIWYHVAVCRQGTNLRAFVDGTQIGTTQTNTTAYDRINSDDFHVGRFITGAGTFTLNGYIDDLRITKGYARYTSNFSVPTGPYEDEGAPLADPFYSSVSLLLPMNGSNNSTTFTDRSPNALTVTANGDAKLSTAVKRYGVSSAVFDGTGDYLSISSSIARLSSGDHTVEMWIYPTAVGGVDGGYFWSQYYASGSPAGRCVFGYSSTGTIFIQLGASSFTTTETYALNTWHHVAYVRSGTTNSLFVNGSLRGSFSSSQTVLDTAVIIGNGNGNTEGSPTWNRAFTGYIDDLRITKGVARYTTAFTPPVAPHPIPVIDPYFGAVSLLLHMNGANASTTFPDHSYNALAVTANGNAQISTAQSKFGGASAYFDGSGDGLSIASTSALQFGTGNFTVECWIYMTANPGSQGSQIIGRHEAGTSADWLFYITQSATLEAYFSNNNTTVTSTGALALNTWIHVAMTRSGNTVSLFVDGTLKNSVSFTASTEQGMGGTYNIASDQNTDESFFTGYIDSLRITKGIARYTANFTPPTTQFPNS